MSTLACFLPNLVTFQTSSVTLVLKSKLNPAAPLYHEQQCLALYVKSEHVILNTCLSIPQMSHDYSPSQKQTLTENI